MRKERKIVYQYDFFVVEMDALAAKMKNIFKNIVLDAADKYFDQNIYDNIIKMTSIARKRSRELVR